MSKPAENPRLDHPLMADLTRLNKILDNMYVHIQKIMFGRSVSPDTEPVLSGGESADDVLQEASLALLEYDPDKLYGTWEGLSVRIATHKAVDAVRRATKGRRAPGNGRDDPDEITVVPLDTVEFKKPAADWGSNPEQTFMSNQQQQVLLRLARDRLSGQEQAVYFGIHFQGRTRADLAGDVGLTPQGVGKMYRRIAESLQAEACRDPAYPTTTQPQEGRTHD